MGPICYNHNDFMECCNKSNLFYICFKCYLPKIGRFGDLINNNRKMRIIVLALLLAGIALSNLSKPFRGGLSSSIGTHSRGESRSRIDEFPDQSHETIHAIRAHRGATERRYREQGTRQ